MFEIRKGLEMPARRGGKGCPPRYPWDKMQPGDSFLVPWDSTKTKLRQNASLSSQANFAGKKYGMKFATRREEGGVSIWRIA